MKVFTDLLYTGAGLLAHREDRKLVRKINNRCATDMQQRYNRGTTEVQQRYNRGIAGEQN